MTIARAVRGLLGFLPDPGEDSNASLEVTLRNFFDQFGAQVVGGIKNLIEDGFRAPLEMHGLATAICRGSAAFDPAIFLQPIEQSSESGPFDAHAFGDFLLGELIPALGEVNERPPFALAQAEGPQALIEPGPPGTGGAEKDETEFTKMRRRHRKKMVSVLTN